MTTEEFSPGDIVALKSGGPLMTVSAVVTDDNPEYESGVYCDWISDDGTPHSKRYFGVQLRKKKEETT